MSIIVSLIDFLSSYRTDSSWRTWWRILRTWGLFYLLVLIYTSLLTYTMPDLTDQFQPIKLIQFITWEHIVFVLLLAVVLWPLMEELAFRAGMKWWWWNVALLLWSLVFVWITYFFDSRFHWLPFNQFWKSISSYMLYILIVIVVFHAIKQRFPRISRWYITFTPWLFWLLTFIFAWVHLSNFDLSGTIDRRIILLVIPQLFLGIMLWFIRMNAWLGASIWIHMFHNLIQLIPIVLLGNAWIQALQQNQPITYLPWSSSWSMVGAWVFGGILFVFFALVIFSELKAIRKYHRLVAH